MHFLKKGAMLYIIVCILKGLLELQGGDLIKGASAPVCPPSKRTPVLALVSKFVVFSFSCGRCWLLW